jgi:predicted Zn-dependent peptidase
VNVALWLEADRMRSLDISAANLKNQQNVVSEEVRVNVLNQPYALFEWLDMWMNANQNWNNAHNFYGDLSEIEAANLQDVRDFFKTYYAPNNAVVTVVGDVETAEVRKMIEQDFAGIPAQPDPPRPDISEPAQTKEKRLQQSDKLANLPALAIGYHLPAQDSPDFAPTILLNLILQGDDSSRLYQRLVKEKEMCLDWNGGVQASVSNEWDYNGPMLLTSRSTYKMGVKVDDILREADAVLADVQQKGVTEKELADAKVRFRSNFYDTVEDTFGKAHILSLLALFHDDPRSINSQLDRYEAVTPEQVKAAANKYLVASNRTIIDRVPEAKGGK